MKLVYVKDSRIHGKGLFVGENVRRGEIIQRINGPKVRKRPKNTRESKKIMNWIGIGKETWIKTAGTPFRYLNHSCDPNAAIVGTKTIIALRPIRKDTEIVIDYSMTDGDPLWSLTCGCGAKKCRKRISSIQSLPPSVFKKHMPHIPRNFQRIYLRSHIQRTSSPTLLKR